MATPAGWYPDPSNPARHRYWDGNQWTEHVHPPEQVAYQDTSQNYQEPAQANQEPAQTYQDTSQGYQDTSQGYQDTSQGYQDRSQTYQEPAQAWPAAAPASAETVTGAATGEPVTADAAWPTAERAADVAGSAETAPTDWQVSADPAVVGQYGQSGGYGAPQAAPGPGAAGTGAVGTNGYGPADGVGGIHTDLLSDSRYGEVASAQRVVLQNSKLLKIVLGEDVLARQGSMVAFQGNVDFDHEGAGAARFLKKALTGEGLALMRCTGRGELFLADGAKNVHVIWMDNAGLSVNGRNVLAFETSLQWDIERVQGASMVAGGLFNTRLHGSGWVAITTKGDPVVLRTDQPTFVDTDAVVAWSAGLTTTVNRTMKAKALIGRGSGEVAQLSFQGTGIVIVQPSEGDGVPPHTH